jgi:hypothetical protein
VTVLDITTTRVRPGRLHDAIALSAEAAKLLERHGAKDCRLLAATMAGEAAGTMVFTAEFDDHAGFGQFMDAVSREAEIEALIDRVSHDDSPSTIVQQALATEVPLGRATTARRGAVVHAFVSRVVTGRYEGSLDLARQVFDFVEGQGAVHAQLFELGAAGTLTGCQVASWEFESMRALGAALDAFGRDATGQAIAGLVHGADSPITFVDSGIYSIVPL